MPQKGSTRSGQSGPVQSAAPVQSSLRGSLTFLFSPPSPVGEFIPAEVVKDPQELNLWYKVNGQLKQEGSTNLMLWRIPELIEHCSSIMRLEEGDLLLTG